MGCVCVCVAAGVWVLGLAFVEASEFLHAVLQKVFDTQEELCCLLRDVMPEYSRANGLPIRQKQSAIVAAPNPGVHRAASPGPLMIIPTNPKHLTETTPPEAHPCALTRTNSNGRSHGND